MIIYSVTVSIDPEIHSDWLEWMRKVHVPDVLATKLFLGYRFLKLQNEEEGGITYNIQYTMPDIEAYETYRTSFAPALQADVARRYEGKFVAFRTLLDVVEEGVFL